VTTLKRDSLDYDRRWRAPPPLNRTFSAGLMRCRFLGALHRAIDERAPLALGCVTMHWLATPTFTLVESYISQPDLATKCDNAEDARPCTTHGPERRAAIGELHLQCSFDAVSVSQGAARGCYEGAPLALDVVSGGTRLQRWRVATAGVARARLEILSAFSFQPSCPHTPQLRSRKGPSKRVLGLFFAGIAAETPHHFD
jgi:hypothetical protein